jgi:2-polyprenyl-3-methyl-5-hydroxy-6-metoxy-1,4-benzoquinol methylase
MNPDIRIQHEVDHGRFLVASGAGEIWNWESPAGKCRWQRRVTMLSSTLKSGFRVLELGCGTGYFTSELAKLDVQVTAIDISPELIAKARETVVAQNVSFEINNAYQMTFANECFDAVVGSSILHHLEIHPALTEVYRVLKPGGSICFTEPNMMNPQIALQKNIPRLKRRLGDSPDETAFFRWRLKRHLLSVGFREVNVIPFDFLHPAVPEKLIKPVSLLSQLFEKTPVFREIAGSLRITGVK